MWKPILVFLLLITPIFASAKQWTMLSGRIFEEKITYHRTLSGVLVSVSEWLEIKDVIKKANAGELNMYQQIHNYILTMSDFYGAHRIEMIGTSNCESDWIKRPDYAITAIGDDGRAFGIFQYFKGWYKGKYIDTFKAFQTEAAKENPKFLNFKRDNWRHQIELSAWAFSKGEKYKDDWTCYRRMFIEEKW